MLFRNGQGTGNAAIQKAGILIFTAFCLNLFASTATELVKNGDFSSTVVTNWPLQRKDSATVTGTITAGQYVITRSAAASASDTNPWFIQFYQKGLTIEKGKTYVVSFSAKADTTFSANLNIGNVPGANTPISYSGYKSYTITKVLDTISFDFKMDSTTDTNSRIVFDLGAMRIKGTITLDNISVKALIDTGGNAQPANERILNGDFSSTNLTGSNWKLATENGSKGAMKVENGQLKVTVTKLGTEQAAWEIQCMQTNVKIDSGHTYRVSLHGKADSIYSSMVYVGINKDPWSSYSGWSNNFMLSPDMDTSNFYFDFSMDTASDPAAKFVITLGSSAVPNTFTFDNISVKCTDCNSGVAEAAPMWKQSPRLQANVNNRHLTVAGISSPVSVRLVNSIGKVVLFRSEMVPFNGTVLLPLQLKMAAGVYFARITEKRDQKNLSSTTVRLINQ